MTSDKVLESIECLVATLDTDENGCMITDELQSLGDTVNQALWVFEEPKGKVRYRILNQGTLEERFHFRLCLGTHGDDPEAEGVTPITHQTIAMCLCHLMIGCLRKKLSILELDRLPLSLNLPYWRRLIEVCFRNVPIHIRITMLPPFS